MITTSGQTFNAAVHGLRGIASLMVFYAHLFGGAAEHVYADKAGFVATQEPYWNFGTYGVWLFFTISGFVILPSALRYSTTEFAARRFMRIYPMFFAFSILFIVLNMVTNHMPELNDGVTIFAALTFTNQFFGTDQLSPNAWSLTYEAIFYALTALVVLFSVKSRRPVALIIILGLALAYTVTRPGTLFFLSGVVICLALNNGWVLRPALRRTIEPFAFAALAYTASRVDVGFQQHEMTQPIAWLILLSTAFYFYLAASPDSLTGRLLSHKVFQFFGTVSFSLYLFHPYIYLPMRLTFVRYELFTDNVALSMILFCIAVTIPTLIGTYLVHKTLEIWPYQAVFHRRIFARGVKAPQTA